MPINSKYVFLQQRDNSCHITSFANFARLRSLRTQAGTHPSKTIDLAKQSELWQTRFEQLPVVSKQLVVWQKAVRKAFRNVDVKNYDSRNRVNGIICGEHYTIDGKKFSDDTFNPIEYYFRLLYTPHTTIDVKLLGSEGDGLAKESSFTTLPIYFNKGKLKVYNPKTKKHDDDFKFIGPINKLTREQKFNKDLIKLHLPNGKWLLLELDQDVRDYYNFPKNKNKNKNIRLNGKSNVFGNEVAFQKMFLPQRFLSHTNYLSSLFDMILLNLGVSREGETITDGHKDQKTYEALSKQMGKDENNPWSSKDIFNKENFLEFQLGEVIKNNSEIKLLLKKHINFSGFYHPHKYFNELDNLYTSKDKATRKKASGMIGKFIPNENLMLAYHLISLMSTLWGAAKSHDAYMAIQELDGVPGLTQLFKLYGLPGANQFINSAYRKQDDGKSFIDVWVQIKDKLLEKESTQKDFVSFCDHGRIISFSDDIRYLQEQHGAKRPELMHKIGFAIIDSYYPKQLAPFYMQSDLSKISMPITSDGKLAKNKRFNNYKNHQNKSIFQMIFDVIKNVFNKIKDLLFNRSKKEVLSSSILDNNLEPCSAVVLPSASLIQSVPYLSASNILENNTAVPKTKDKISISDSISKPVLRRAVSNK